MSSTSSIKKETGTFPILKDDAICSCMKELNMDLDVASLRAPKPKQLATIYENFVDLLMGVSRDEAMQPQFAALDVLEHPELHETSIGEIMFMKSL